MVRKYPKGIPQVVSHHFKSVDFDCRCDNILCDSTYIDDDLVSGLENMVAMSNELLVNSGYRCIVHNRNEGGKDDSLHLKGMAADIVCKWDAMDGEKIAKVADKVGVFHGGGIGYGITGGTKPHLCHVDTGKKRRWTYT